MLRNLPIKYNYETIDEMVDGFVEDRVGFSPFFEHLEGFFEMKHKPELFITSYERILKVTLSHNSCNWHLNFSMHFHISYRFSDSRNRKLR